MADEIGLIQGSIPDSINEWYVSLALEKYGIDYKYQLPLFGGHIRGGQILDFLVFNPFETAVTLFGEYYHKGQLDADERFKLAQIEQKFGKDRVVILWGSETETRELAEQVVVERLL